MKKIMIAALAGLVGTAALADVYRFDHDGGSCDYSGTNYEEQFAEIGSEGLFLVDAQIRHADIDGYILEERHLKNGLIHYTVGIEYAPADTNYRFEYTVDPVRGYIGASFYYDHRDMEPEGIIDVVKLQRCR